MSSPRPDEGQESKAIETARRLAQAHLEIAIKKRGPVDYDDVVRMDNIADELFAFLQRNPGVTPEILSEFILKPIGLNQPIGLKILFEATQSMDPTQDDNVHIRFDIVSEIIKKASPVIATMNEKDLVTELLEAPVISDDFDKHTLIFFLTPLLELLKIANVTSTDYGKLFKIINDSINENYFYSGINGIKSQKVSDYFTVLKHADPSAFQTLRSSREWRRDRAELSLAQRLYKPLSLYLRTNLDNVIENLDSPDLFHMLLNKMGPHNLGVLLLEVQAVHDKNFSVFNKPSSIFEIWPKHFLQPKHPESSRKFNDYVLLLNDPVKFFEKHPKECIDLLVQLTKFPIEDLTQHHGIEKLLSKIINYLEQHPNPDYLRILCYIKAKLDYSEFLNLHKKSELETSRPEPLTPEKFKEQLEKFEKEKPSSQQLLHDSAVKLWLRIEPEQLPIEIIIPSDLTSIGHILFGSSNLPTFHGELDSIDIQIRALQYFYQAALRNDSDAIEKLGIMANTFGMPEEKQEKKREPKSLLFFHFNKPAMEEPLSLDEKIAPAAPPERIHKQYLAMLDILTSQPVAKSSPAKR